MKTDIIQKLLYWQYENKHLLIGSPALVIGNRYVHLHIKINSSSEFRDCVFDLKTGNYKILNSWTDEKTRKTKFDYKSINKKD